MAAAAAPARFAHILAASPFNDSNSKIEPSSPADSPHSDIPRYFGEHDYEDRKYSYSSPPSSVPSSTNSTYEHSSYQAFPDYCRDAPYIYSSSPLAHNSQQHYQLPPPPPMQQQLAPPYMLQHATHIQPYHPQQAPRANIIPGLAIDKGDSNINPSLHDQDSQDRPEPKRRKTCPEIFTHDSSPTSAMKLATAKKGAGKDGEDVWPTEVEVAFFESIRLVPKLGRKKIVVNGKPCGRNELIGDYIRRKTGALRSRKQVSSHIQVLKNIRRHDWEFMNLVAEPKAGEVEEDFTPEAHNLFFAPQEFAHVQPEPLMPPVPPSFVGLSPAMQRDGLLSPYCGSFFSHASSSGPSSPALSASSGRSLSPYHSMANTPSTEELPQQVYQMHLAPNAAHLVHRPETYSQMEHMQYQQMTPHPVENRQSAISVLPPPPQITSINVDATPKSSPSKLGHRRAASRGLSLHIPPNTFGQQNRLAAPGQTTQGDGRDLMPSSHVQVPQSNPSTPWPQMLHTPTCPPPAPAMLPSPTQKNRLAAIWANTSEDWNKASPALEKSFDHELSAAVLSSQNMQKAAARASAPLKRSYTDVPLSHTSTIYHQEEQNGRELKQDDDKFFTSLLGSREF